MSSESNAVIFIHPPPQGGGVKTPQLGNGTPHRQSVDCSLLNVEGVYIYASDKFTPP